MRRARWWNTGCKLGRVGRSIWFWAPDRETPTGWMGTDVRWDNRWFWVGPLEVCWLSRQYMAVEGID